MAGHSINWKEGQFIHPHHFQQGFLEMQEQIESVTAHFVPHAYGLADLDFSESDCENENFLINRIDCRFPSGARLTYPGNAQIASRGFSRQLNENKGSLKVYLGLPELSAEEPNCLSYDAEASGGHRYRYVSQMKKLCDFADGGAPREIEVKLYNPKILFEGESTFGYEIIPIAMVVRSGQFGAVPKAERGFVPPCIDVEASTRLVEIMREIGNRLVNKNRAMRAYWNSKDTANMMKARDGFKVQSMAVAANAFSQLASIRNLHPFNLYLRIVEVIGMLSIYCTDDRLVEAPQYQHDDLQHCFTTVHNNLVALLAQLEETTYESRVFDMKGDLLVCPMEAAWFDDQYDAYICFEAGIDEDAIRAKIPGLKVASENVIPILNKRRIRGMAVEGPTHHLTHLPSTPNHHYFKVPRDTTYYPKLLEHPTLAIWGDCSFADLVTLYIVERNT